MAQKFDWNHPFSKQNMESGKAGEAEDKKVVIGEQKIRILPSNPMWRWIFNILIGVFCLSMTGFLLCMWLPNIARSRIGDLSPAALAISASLMVLLYMTKLKPPRMDRWLRDIAKKQLSTEYIFFRKKSLFIHYDVNLNRKDLLDFVNEMNAKSERFTYYLVDVDIDSYTCTLEVAKKREIPKRCSVDPKDDKEWNVVPMGKAVNHEERDVTDIGWYLNDELKKDHCVNTLPSSHMLIAGGTGSGKSVVENGIIGHITRHPEHYQACLCDVKMVEFNGLDQYAGIHQVALTIESVANLLDQMQRIMMERFDFMRKQGVNNIYKIKDQRVDWFTITGEDGKRVKMQFDEVIPCKVNGDEKLLSISQIYDAVQNGDEVDVEPEHLVVD